MDLKRFCAVTNEIIFCYFQYIVKLEKGDYQLKMHIRDDKKDYLDKMVDTPMQIIQKLTTPITLDVYSSHSQALIGGKKTGVIHSLNLISTPLYLAPISVDK